jgi:hypothetical protein
MICPTIAMAGLAEAALSYDLVISWAVLVLALVLMVIGLVMRSWKFELVPVVIVLAFTVLCMPWTPFQSVETDDPDAVFWVSQYRIQGVFWAVLVLAVGASFYRCLRVGIKRARANRDGA